ncbi:protein-lysine methyltransferase METTL21D-like protein [Dinothrombium tinctorium]|uniref:Protein-lysine methyltransferase METTL21D-like protein n=1 Tax=Dinothrombium tinctorium TaxID=1965070 RepID=A0A443QV55_9ACAR|nr:protein-lysine methyltransferase METTL21D-like protein [Dinothrombium tinctorium]
MDARDSLCFCRVLEIDAFENEDVRVSIAQRTLGDVGVVVWDAALLLAKFLDYRAKRFPNCFKGTHGLELGAGTGLCGITAALLGCNVLLTDLPNLVPLLDENINRNKAIVSQCNGGNIFARSWHWADVDAIETVFADTGFHIKSLDFVFISDCIYYEKGLQPLIATIKWLCKHCKPTIKIFLSYEEREEHCKLIETFFKLISHSSICWREIGAEEHHPSFTSPDLHLILIQPEKKENLTELINKFKSFLFFFEVI